MSDHHRLQEISADNAQSLKTLQRAITNSQGQFSLIIVRCNYARLRSQILQLLSEQSSLVIQQLPLESSTKKLYTTVLDRFGQQQPDVLIVWGFETLVDLDGLLYATNNVRDSFLHFTFPIILWVNDTVWSQLRRKAPDFTNWASPIVEFKLTDQELITLLRENARQAFAEQPEFSLDNTELKVTQQYLQNHGQKLEPDLQATLTFISGLNFYNNSQFDEAIKQYEQSLKFWQDNCQFEHSSIVLFHLVLTYYLKGKQARKEIKQEIKACIQKFLEMFAKISSPNWLAKHINKLGEVLRQLEDWEQLQLLAQKSLELHQDKEGEELRHLGQDYSFLAAVALKKDSDLQNANKLALQALEILHKIPNPEPQVLGLIYLILAQSQRQLGRIDDAISNLEEARKRSQPQYDPNLYVEILEELRDIQFKRGKYLEAFHLKQEQRKIENQYGLRAFIGAGRLQSPRQVEPITACIGGIHDLSIEDIVAASGRQKDVEALIERIKRRDRKLTVIYGPSGVGKSSIVQAALVPALEKTYFEGREILPILLQDYKNWVGRLGESLAKVLKINFQPSNLSNLIEQLYENEYRNLLTVLIFDQFEEFFFDNKNPVAKQEFYEFLHYSLKIPYLKIILSLREDYIHYLLEISRNVELNIDKNYDDIIYYLAKFSIKDAKALIQSLTARSTFSLESDLIEQLVKDLAGQWGVVRPIELQVVGTQLETEKITTLKDYQKLGSRPEEKLVEKFLETAVKDCGKENERDTNLILYLLTNENNTRPLKTEKELEEDLDISEEKLGLVLAILEGAGLVFRVPGVPDRYQLVHDYLVSFIRQKYQPQSLELEQTKKELRDALHQTQMQSVIAQCNACKAFWLAHQQIEALITSVKAGKQVKEENLRQPKVINLATGTLVNLVYSLREYNRLEKDNSVVYSVAFSPDGQTIASANEDKTVKLWRKDGTFTTNLTGHDGIVLSVSFSPDGTTIASGSWDKTVKLWNKKDGHLINTLSGHNDTIYRVSFSPDGETIASASWDGTVKLWKKDGNLITTLSESIVYSVSFSPGGKTIASGSADKTVKLWDTDGRLIYSLAGHDDTVYSVSISPGGKTIASGSADKTVKLWDTDGRLIYSLAGHDDTVYSVSFSPDGETIASGSADNTVKLWNKDGHLINTLTGHSASIYSVSFSPDGEIIVSGSADNTVKLWSKDGYLITTLTGHNASIYSVSFSPDGKTIVSGSADGSLKLWGKNGQAINTLIGDNTKIFSASFSPDGETIASGSTNNTVKLWNKNGTLITTLNGHNGVVLSVNFSPDGETIASGSADNTVKLWNKDGRLITTLTGHNDIVYDISFSPDGETIASGSADNTIKLWNKNGTLITTLNGHNGVVLSVNFSPDSMTIASASVDNTVKLWRKNVTPMTTLAEHNGTVFSVSFSPDGKIIASASEDQTVKLWKKDGKLITTLTGHNAVVYNISFSPDGETIASASEDQTVKLWKKDGKLITTLTGHNDIVYSVSFSPDGSKIASGSWDNTVKLWDKDGHLINTLYGHKNRIYSVSFSPDGRTIASASADGTVKLWKTVKLDNEASHLITTLIGHKGTVYCVSFSPDGQIIASASADKTVLLWNKDGSFITNLTGHKAKVFSVSFSPDGETIASGSTDTNVALWNKDGSLITTLAGHSDTVFSVSFSPDGKTIASGSADSKVRLWNFSLTDLLVQGCNCLDDYLKTNPNVEERDRSLCDGICLQK